MSAAFGVHFGSTNACLAVCQDKNGKTEVIANAAGDRVTAAMVAFTDHDKTVGAAAKQGLIRNAPNTVCFVKEVIGRAFDHEDIQRLIADSPVKIVEKDGLPMYDVEYKEKRALFSPDSISSLVYKKMMETAESHGGVTDTHDAVLTMPINFDDAQRKAVRAAATSAGFNVLRVISEPVAAVLAYHIGQSDTSETINVLVFRLGGRSLDLTVVRCVGGMYHVVATHTDRSVGGQVLDGFIVQQLLAEFQRKWKSDCRGNKRAIAKLHVAAQLCKHILSTMQTAQASIDSLYEGIDFQSTVSRARFDGLCAAFFLRCLEPLDSFFTNAGISKSDIQKVVLCGGTTKVPSLQKMLQDYFSDAQFLCTIPPDEVIATGAAIQASILCGDDQTDLDERAAACDVDCLTADILVQTEGLEPMVTVLPRYTPVPARQQRQWTLAGEQTAFCLHILQSTANPDLPESLAKVVMKDLPAGAKINAVFHVRSDLSLHVTCTESSTNAMQDVTIENESVDAEET